MQTRGLDAEVKVTFCIPLFNRADLVGETLDSLLAQTDPHWEAVVVDDGSTDNSYAVVEAYARRDERIRLLRRARAPKGACTCRNIAVEEARGEYVMFLDTDDLVAPFCVAQRTHALSDDPSLDFAVFPVLLFRERPEEAHALWNVESDTPDLIRMLYLDPICGGTGTLWRRDSFVRLGFWNETLAMWQDVELHIRAFSGAWRYVRRFDLPPDTFIRELQGSLSRGGYNTRAKVESRIRVIQRAAGVLSETGHVALVAELRYLAAGVVRSTIKGGHLDLTRSFLRWASGNGIFSTSETRRFRWFAWLRKTRFDRLPGVLATVEHTFANYACPSTLCVIPPPDSSLRSV